MKLVVGNQKTYLNKEEVLSFIEKTKTSKCSEVIICPSYLFMDLYKQNSDYILGAQKKKKKVNGGTTGEISASQLKSMGATLSIVGHSERRQDQNEKSENIVNKLNRLQEQGLNAILCVGESKEQRELCGSNDHWYVIEMDSVYSLFTCENETISLSDSLTGACSF